MRAGNVMAALLHTPPRLVNFVKSPVIFRGPTAVHFSTVQDPKSKNIFSKQSSFYFAQHGTQRCGWIDSLYPSPHTLNSKSECPPLFDGTTRLYYNDISPYAQRVCVAVNYKGLKDIEFVEINLVDKPIWYKEKVYPVGKVPALEHNGKVMGESLDLLQYLDKHFGGPLLYPTEEAKKEAAAELLEYTDTFNKAGFTILSLKDAAPLEIHEALSPALDYIENTLGKYANEGPFFLGKFGVVDVAYAPFIERFELALSGIKNYDITVGRPNLTKWIEAVNKVEAYTTTKVDRNILLDLYKKMLENDYFKKVGIVEDQTQPPQYL